jgi:hypothetical protein
MCRQRQTIFTPKSNVELELAEEDEEEEEEEEEDKEEGDYGEESFGLVMQLVSCGKYEEAVLLAYRLWVNQIDIYFINSMVMSRYLLMH